MWPWAGLCTLGFSLSICSVAWQPLLQSAAGLGRDQAWAWGLMEQTADAKGGCHPRLGEMRLDSGETRPRVMKYMNKERHQLQVWLVLSSD